MKRNIMRFVAAIFFAALATANSEASLALASPSQTVNLPERNFQFASEDDDSPEITDRVARISFLIGEAKIRRLGSEEWEKATRNLPLVEGDEIVTDQNARLEIQFNKDQHLRLAENSYLRILNLKDEKVALSLSLGTLSLRITSFERDKSSFEIDAPKTTLAVQSAGSYRIDAGDQGDSEVRLTASDGGEARIYSDSAGFVLKSGRSAVIFTSGDRAGEWDTTAAARYRDDFTMWSSERESVISKLLKDAFYDKYYDSDIYGAEDLNDHGDWIHTTSYGYVWRPNRSATVRYADWSPYRYGHWRWVAPFGWTWINDEPWGWSTYHHGRWFYHGGYWNWSPYGYYRQSRSWWSPALVVVSIFNNNICWYPLPYHRPRQNYNHHGGGPRGNGQPIVVPHRKVSTRNLNPNANGKVIKNGDTNEPIDRVPPIGVVIINSDDLGKKILARRAPTDLAKTVLAKSPDDGSGQFLPAYSDKRYRNNSDIVAERPKIDIAANPSKVGAGPRKPDTPADNDSRERRIFGSRPIRNAADETRPIRSIEPGIKPPRDTGVVDRRPPVKTDIPVEPQPQRPIRQVSPDIWVEPEPKRQTPKEPTRNEQPIERKRPQYEPPVQQEKPRNQPPPVREKPRADTPSPPPVKEPRRSDPPPAKGSPKSDTSPTETGKVKPDNSSN